MTRAISVTESLHRATTPRKLRRAASRSQVLASNLTIANLIGSTGGGVAAIFAADIGKCADGTCANNAFVSNGTGFVVSTGPMATPLPGTLPLLLSGLAGLAALFRSRTRAQGRGAAQFAPA